MNTYSSPQKISKTLPAIDPYAANSIPAYPDTDLPSETEPLAKLAHLTDNAGLSALAPQLQAALDEITCPQNDIVIAMRENVSRLQDGFVEALYDALSSHQIDLQEKMTLRLDAHDNLVSAERRPGQPALEALLLNLPELALAFKEIAMQSELLRDIGNIGKVMANSRLNAEGRSWSVNRSIYQISLKGEMNHFYFSRACAAS